MIIVVSLCKGSFSLYISKLNCTVPMKSSYHSTADAGKLHTTGKYKTWMNNLSFCMYSRVIIDADPQKELINY